MDKGRQMKDANTYRCSKMITTCEVSFYQKPYTLRTMFLDDKVIHDIKTNCWSTIGNQVLIGNKEKLL